MVSEQEKNNLREELAHYLDEFKTKVGSDGKQLLHYPANFEVVAGAMNRSDLTSTEEKPWSKYLLSQKFDEQLDQGGRYKNLQDNNNVTTKIEQGMAEIHMLDNQLLSVSKKAINLKVALQQMQQQSEENTMSETGSEAPSSARKSARSVLSRYDQTFLTRAKSDTTRSVTARSESNEYGNALPADGELAVLDESPECEDGDEDRGGENNETNANQAKKIGRDFQQENMFGMKGRPSLTPEEESRVYALLEIDEEGAEWRELSKYGFTATQEQHVADLDRRLASFGRTDRLLTANITPTPAPERTRERERERDKERGKHLDGQESMSPPALHMSSFRDYLGEQRLAREQQDYSTKLDVLLRAYASDAIDLSGLVAGPTPTPAPPTDRVEHSSHSHGKAPRSFASTLGVAVDAMKKGTSRTSKKGGANKSTTAEKGEKSSANSSNSSINNNNNNSGHDIDGRPQLPPSSSPDKQRSLLDVPLLSAVGMNKPQRITGLEIARLVHSAVVEAASRPINLISDKREIDQHDSSISRDKDAGEVGSVNGEEGEAEGGKGRGAADRAVGEEREEGGEGSARGGKTASVSVEALALGSLRAALAPRQEIDRLLCGLRGEVNRLFELRKNLEVAMHINTSVAEEGSGSDEDMEPSKHGHTGSSDNSSAISNKRSKCNHTKKKDESSRDYYHNEYDNTIGEEDGLEDEDYTVYMSRRPLSSGGGGEWTVEPPPAFCPPFFWEVQVQDPRPVAAVWRGL